MNDRELSRVLRAHGLRLAPPAAWPRDADVGEAGPGEAASGEAAPPDIGTPLPGGCAATGARRAAGRAAGRVTRLVRVVPDHAAATEADVRTVLVGPGGRILATCG